MRRNCLDTDLLEDMNLIIFTDLDGSLLDPETYRWDAAAAALKRCMQHNIAIICNTSKTSAEMIHFHSQLPLPWPAIVENGGGILYPPDAKDSFSPNAEHKGRWYTRALGPSYSEIRKAMQQIRDSTKIGLKGFGDMPIAEIQAFTGLDDESVRRSVCREFDEPFLLDEDRDEHIHMLRKHAARLGLRVTPGGRFYHLHGPFDKGTALRRLLADRKQKQGNLITMALGDSDNDIPMLESVTYPIWLAADAQKKPKHIPNLIQPSKPGPQGWNEAVLRLIDRLKEP